MSLIFGANTTDNVQVAAAASIDSLSTYTVLLWVYPTTLTDVRRLIEKTSIAAGLWTLRLSGTGGNVRFLNLRAGGNTDYISSNTPLSTLSVWHFVAATFDTNATPTSHIYTGTLAAVAAECTYGTSTDAGTSLSLTNGVMRIGNAAGTANSPFQGSIANAMLINRVMTLGEIISHQFRTAVPSGCVFYNECGYAGTGTQPDWSGNANSGAVTGATAGGHVPLGPLFGDNLEWQGAFSSINAYTLALAQGSYTLTGQAVALKADRSLTLAQGSYSLTGQAVGLAFGHMIAAAQGSYTLTGQPVALKATRQLALAQGSYLLSGQSVNLVHGYTLGLNQGSYTLTGEPVTLKADRKLALAQGSYALTGQAVSLPYVKKLSPSTGFYTLTGEDVGLHYSNAKNVTITLDQGSYTLSGKNVGLSCQRNLILEHGVYTLTGQDLRILSPIQLQESLPNIPRTLETTASRNKFAASVSEIINSLIRGGQFTRMDDNTWTNVITSDVLAASEFAASGTYVPTLTSQVNLDSATANQAVYSRIGDIVTVSGSVTVDPTATGLTSFKLSLPIASDLSAVTDCSGVANVIVSGAVAEGGVVLGNTLGDVAFVEWVAATIALAVLYYQFQYIVR